jgi:hypothetical protein
MSIYDTSLIAPVTVAQMVDAYNHAVSVIREGIPKLAEAQQRMESVFGTQYSHFQIIGDVFGNNRKYRWDCFNPEMYMDDVQDHLRREVWRQVLNKIQADKMMSAKRLKEVRERLDREEVEEVTIENIMAFLVVLAENAGEIHKEIVIAAYEFMRPSPWGSTKTEARTRNYGIGKKVVMRGVVDISWDGSRLGLSTWSRDKICEIDKAFHLLDGKGVPDGYVTPLADAIGRDDTRTGETDYFAFKKFKNGNLHLEIRRDDLLAKFNQICAERALTRARE